MSLATSPCWQVEEAGQRQPEQGLPVESHYPTVWAGSSRPFAVDNNETVTNGYLSSPTTTTNERTTLQTVTFPHCQPDQTVTFHQQPDQWCSAPGWWWWRWKRRVIFIKSILRGKSNSLLRGSDASQPSGVGERSTPPQELFHFDENHTLTLMTLLACSVSVPRSPAPSDFT